MISSIAEFLFDLLFWNITGIFSTWIVDCVILDSQSCDSLIVAAFVCSITRVIWEIKLALDELHAERLEDSDDDED